MGREAVAVVLGYAMIFLVVFITFSLLFVTLGPEGAFQPETYEVSGTWAGTSLILSFIAAIVGGLTCAAVARRSATPKVLALVVLVLGLLLAIPVVLASGGAEMARAGDVPMMEAMTEARQPVWIALVNPLIGAVGVLLGARLKPER